MVVDGNCVVLTVDWPLLKLDTVADVERVLVEDCGVVELIEELTPCDNSVLELV